MKRLIVLLCAFLLAACNRNESDGSIKIGLVASLTGPAGEQGKNWVEGAELAVDDLKARGIKVRLLVEDDQTEPAKAASAFNKLALLERVQGVVGGTWDYLAETLYPLALQRKIPFITPTNPEEVLSAEAKTNPYIFTNGLSLKAVGESAREFFTQGRYKSVGIVYPNLPYGTVQADLVEQIAKELSMEVLFRYEFPVSAPMGDNVRLAALRIQERIPDITFTVLDYNGIDLITKEFARLKINPAIIETQHLDQAFQFSKDPSRYRAAYGIYPRVTDEAFNNRFAAKFGYPPKVFAAHGYDAVTFLAESIAKGIDVANPSTAFSYHGVTGEHRLPAPSRGLVTNTAIVMTTKNGIFEEYHP